LSKTISAVSAASALLVVSRGRWKIASDQLSSPGALEFTERTTQTSILIQWG